MYACCDGRHHGARSALGSSLLPLGTRARPPVQTCQRCATESPFYDQLFVEGIVKGTFNPNKLSQLRTKYCMMISSQRKLWKHSVISNTAVIKQDILEIFRFSFWKQSKINSHNHSNGKSSIVHINLLLVLIFIK